MVFWTCSLCFTWTISEGENIHETWQPLEIRRAARIHYCLFSIFRDPDEIQTSNHESEENHPDCGVVPYLHLFLSSFLFTELSYMALRLIYWKTLVLRIVSYCLFLLLLFQGCFLPPPPHRYYFACVCSISSWYSSRWLGNFSMTE